VSVKTGGVAALKVMVVTFGVVESEVVSWLTTTGSSPQVVLAALSPLSPEKLATQWYVPALEAV